MLIKHKIGKVAIIDKLSMSNNIVLFNGLTYPKY